MTVTSEDDRFEWDSEKDNVNIKVLSVKRLEEIKNLPITFDDDLPEFKDEDLKGFNFAHPEYFEIKHKKKAISIKLDIDVIEALKRQGSSYQSRINSILRAYLFNNSN